MKRDIYHGKECVIFTKEEFVDIQTKILAQKELIESVLKKVS